MTVYKRYPFYVLGYDKANISINKEIMYDGSDLYMNVGGNIIKATDVTISQSIGKIVDKLYESMSNRYTSIDDMIDEYNNSKTQIDRIYDGVPEQGILSINEIKDKFRGLDKNINLGKYVDSLTKIGASSGVLSENDFSDTHKETLDRAEFGAKKYIHPESKQCGYISPVQSVFGRTGDVVVTKEDMGLGNIDPNANNYIHPRSIQCDVDYVSSINGITLPNIKVSKGTIGLGVLDNAYPSRSISNIENKVDDQYLVVNDNCRKYISDRVKEIRKIPTISNTIDLNISIDNNPDISNSMYMLTVVTVYKKDLDISRRYIKSPTHSFKVFPGKYVVKIEGYDNKDYIIKTKHISIYKDTDITIKIEED